MTHEQDPQRSTQNNSPEASQGSGSGIENAYGLGMNSTDIAGLLQTKPSKVAALLIALWLLQGLVTNQSTDPIFRTIFSALVVVLIVALLVSLFFNKDGHNGDGGPPP